MQELPFSSHLLELYWRYTTCQDPDERRRISLEIAEEFASDHDLTDAKACEDYHQFFEDYEQARLKFEHVSARLSRFAVHLIGDVLSENDITIDSIIRKNDKNAN